MEYLGTVAMDLCGTLPPKTTKYPEKNLPVGDATEKPE